MTVGVCDECEIWQDRVGVHSRVKKKYTKRTLKFSKRFGAVGYRRGGGSGGGFIVMSRKNRRNKLGSSLGGWRFPTRNSSRDEREIWQEGVWGPRSYSLLKLRISSEALNLRRWRNRGRERGRGKEMGGRRRFPLRKCLLSERPDLRSAAYVEGRDSTLYSDRESLPMISS